MLESPCIGICSYIAPPDSEKFCRGCGRTTEEIAQWGRSNDKEQAIILQKSKERKKSI
jgi:predicted Fe-S protein YdhL (DUF1289 family)